MVRPGGPLVLKGASLALDLGPQLAQGAPTGDWVLFGVPRPFERAQLSAENLVYIRRNIATATPHRRVRDPCGGPVEHCECVGARCTPLATSLVQDK